MHKHKHEWRQSSKMGEVYCVAGDCLERRNIFALETRIKKLEHIIYVEEQTIRNIGTGELTGDAQQIALNSAKNLRAALKDSS